LIHYNLRGLRISAECPHKRNNPSDKRPSEEKIQSEKCSEISLLPSDYRGEKVERYHDEKKEQPSHHSDRGDIHSILLCGRALIGGLIHANHKFISSELRHPQNSTRDRACPDVPYRHRTEDGRMHRITLLPRLSYFFCHHRPVVKRRMVRCRHLPTNGLTIFLCAD
jgi:hypothetical protein